MTVNDLTSLCVGFPTEKTGIMVEDSFSEQRLGANKF